MVSGPSSEELRGAELEARVRALEDALRERSRRLRQLQRMVGPAALEALDRLETREPAADAGLGLETWNETTELTPADVEEALEGLWADLEDARERARGTPRE